MHFPECSDFLFPALHDKPGQRGSGRCDVRSCSDHRVPGGALRGLSFIKSHTMCRQLPQTTAQWICLHLLASTDTETDFTLVWWVRVSRTGEAVESISWRRLRSLAAVAGELKKTLRLKCIWVDCLNLSVGLFVRKIPKSNVEESSIESSLLSSIHRFKSNHGRAHQQADQREMERICLIPDSQWSCSRALMALQCRAALFAAVTTGFPSWQLLHPPAEEFLTKHRQDGFHSSHPSERLF